MQCAFHSTDTFETCMHAYRCRLPFVFHDPRREHDADEPDNDFVERALPKQRVPSCHSVLHKKRQKYVVIIFLSRSNNYWNGAATHRSSNRAAHHCELLNAAYFSYICLLGDSFAVIFRTTRAHMFVQHKTGAMAICSVEFVTQQSRLVEPSSINRNEFRNCNSMIFTFKSITQCILTRAPHCFWSLLHCIQSVFMLFTGWTAINLKARRYGFNIRPYWMDDADRWDPHQLYI